MKTVRTLIALLAASAGPALAADKPAAPRAGTECMSTDYDCQPTALTEEDYDKMATSVPMLRDLPALVELEPLDPSTALIQRFMLNARGIMAREVPIEQSKGMFCTLSHATNLKLTYFPASGLWSFVIDFSPNAELLAGGLATCLSTAALAPGGAS
jgi:hypothetical protein